MSTTYNYYTGPLVDIATRVSTLDSKILIDLEISATYTSTTYNVTTGNVEVVFSSALPTTSINILNNLTNIILYDGAVGNTVYVVDSSAFNRRSFGVTGAPTVNNDSIDGYAPGSMVTTTNNDIYFCTSNATGAAAWPKLFTSTSPDTREYIYAVRGVSGVAGTAISVTTTAAGDLVALDNIVDSFGTWSLTATGGVLVGKTGVYECDYNECFLASNTVIVSAILKKNGTMIGGSQATARLNNNEQGQYGASMILSANANDIITLFARASNNARATVPTQSGSGAQFSGLAPVASIRLYRIR